MEGLVDIMRMKLLANTSKDKDDWKYYVIMIILSNPKKFFHELKKIILTICLKIGMLRKCIPSPEVKLPRSVVKLKFFKDDTNNKILKELLSRHSQEFDIVQLREPHQWHVVQPKTIKLDEDIFFKVEFPETLRETKDKKKRKSNNDCSDSDDDEDLDRETRKKDKQEAMRLLTKDFELMDTKGQVFSYNLTLKDLLDYLHKNYVSPEPKFVVPIELPKRVNLFNMNVARATNFDMKTDELKGEWLEFTVSKNLNNIFLEPEIREKLMSQIDRFNDLVWYAERGLPRTLGIMLHGKPGCGKTSFIKAISAYMKRKVLIVDFKLVKTVSHLRKIFAGTMRDDKREDLTHQTRRENTVYVFEDFDCMSEVFMDRTLKKKEQDEERESEKTVAASSVLENMLLLKRMEMMEKEKLE